MKAASCASERIWGEAMETAKTAVALGLFDGVHLGHRAVLKLACGQRKNGLIPAVFTFEPQSVSYKTGGAQGFIYGRQYKHRLLDKCGIERILSPEFEKLRTLSGEEFAETVLKQQFNAAFVCCGRDFRFGKNASCGTEELAEICGRLGIEIQTAEDVVCDGENISSRRIRTLINEGNIRRANELLGEPYTLSGEVVDGNRIGRTIDFPTANQNFLSGQLVLRYGVYKTVTCIDGTRFPSVTNVGVKPTISGTRAPLAETHIIGFSGSLYGRTIDVSFIDFIRPERRFDSLDALKKQIHADILQCL